MSYPQIRLLVLEDYDFYSNGGIENVVRSLIPELDAACDCLMWVVPEHKLAFRQDEGFLSSERVLSLKPVFLGRGWLPYFLGRLLAKVNLSQYGHMVQKKLSEQAMNQRLQYLIGKYNISHLLSIAVFDQPVPRVLIPIYGIVHDLNYAPQWREKCLACFREWKRKASGIITISNWSKKQMDEVFITLGAPVTAIPHSIALPVKSDSINTLSKYHSQTVTFFYPATFSPHKRHACLLKAFSILYKQGYRFKLVLCGHGTDKLLLSHPLETAELEAARSILHSSGSDLLACVSILGVVEQSVLEGLFADADYVVLPTTYEGFGLPLSEALIRGVPIICSDIPPFREQTDFYDITQGVIFVKKNTPTEWASAIQLQLDTPAEMRIAPLGAFEAMAKWRWSDVAKAYLKLMADEKAHRILHNKNLTSRLHRCNK